MVPRCLRSSRYALGRYSSGSRNTNTTVALNVKQRISLFNVEAAGKTEINQRPASASRIVTWHFLVRYRRRHHVDLLYFSMPVCSCRRC